MAKTTQFEGRKYSGNLYAKKYGTSDPFENLGNCASMTITSETEKDELLSTGKYDYGQVISSVITQKSVTLSAEFNSFDMNALSRALMGKPIENTTSSQAFSVSLTVAEGFLELGVIDINPETVKIDGNKSDDYQLVEFSGLIKFDLSKFNKGDVVTVSGNTKGGTTVSIAGYSMQDIVLEMKLDGRDRISGRNGTLHIPHAVLASNANIDWFSEDWWKNGLEGSLVKDEGKETFTFIEKID